MALMHGSPIQLYLSELAGKVFALLAFAGLVVLLLRRLTHGKIRVVTSPMDWVVLVLLLNQVFLGMWTAFFYRWGATWFIQTATPWVGLPGDLPSQPQYVTALPLVPKLHFLNATLLIALFPFSRLVHMVTFPVNYIWRRLQLVIWNRRPAH